MRIVLFDDQYIWKSFWPITITRPLSEVRVGILTLAEKRKTHLECDVKYICEDYLQEKYKKNITEENNIFINSSVIPNSELVTELLQLNEGESLIHNSTLIAYRRKFGAISQGYEEREYGGVLSKINKITDLITLQAQEIEKDYHLLTHGRHSLRINDAYTTHYGKDVFLEEGVDIKSAILNAEEGPIYIGKNCKIEEGAIIKGPFGMLDGSVVTMGARIRKGVSLGPKCVAGGELKNTILQGYTNKAHDGYIGDSYIGEWCNFGAGTTCSNLKNNWTNVKLWDQKSGKENDSGVQKIGLVIGDHCMTAIGTLFNTGSVIGLSCNIFQHGFAEKHLPSFSWGDNNVYNFDQLLNSIEHMKNTKKEELTSVDKKILEFVYQNRVS